MRMAMLVGAGAVALAAAGTAAGADRVAYTGTFDADPGTERVLVRDAPCPQADAGRTCRVVAVDDAGRITPVSTPAMAGYGYGATATARVVRLGGAPRILIRKDTVGGTGSSPAEITVVRWDGARGRTMLRLAKTTRGLPAGFAYVSAVSARPFAGGRLLTREALNRSEDPTCCASAVRVRVWAARGDRLVVTSTRVRPT